jgi:hypothetical protein
LSTSSEPPDELTRLELALGQFVVSYGLLTMLVKGVAITLLNPLDAHPGHIVLDGASDDTLMRVWRDLAIRRARGNRDEAAAVRAIYSELGKLRKDRNRSVHGTYIAMFDGRDPGSVEEYRAAPRGRVTYDRAGLNVEPLDVATIEELVLRSEDLRARFLQFIPTTTSP